MTRPVVRLRQCSSPALLDGSWRWLLVPPALPREHWQRSPCCCMPSPRDAQKPDLGASGLGVPVWQLCRLAHICTHSLRHGALQLLPACVLASGIADSANSSMTEQPCRLLQRALVYCFAVPAVMYLWLLAPESVVGNVYGLAGVPPRQYA